MTLKAGLDRENEINERINLQKKEKEMRELLKDTSVLRKRDENGKYILKPVVIEETVAEPEPIEEPKTTQIIRKTVMEKDHEGFLLPVTGVFELDLLTNEETLKQKISVTTTSEKSETIIENFDLKGKLINKEIIVKKIAPVVVEQKNTKDQKNTEVRKKFVEANHEVDPNVELAEQKIRNAKALALVKEKERIAKEQAEKEKQKAEKERLKQEKEFAQKVARDHEAQKKNPKTKQQSALLSETLEEAPVENLQSKKKRELAEENTQRNKQTKQTNALAKRGAALSKKPVKKIKAVAEEIASHNYLIVGVVFCVIFALAAIFFVPTLIK